MELTYREAKQEAKKLADRLNKYFKIEKWKPRVWDNLGWHYDVNLGSISVSGNEIYTAYVSPSLNEPGGALAAWWNDKHRDKSPEKAVLKALKFATEYVNDLQAVINDNKSKLKI